MWSPYGVPIHEVKVDGKLGSYQWGGGGDLIGGGIK